MRILVVGAGAIGGYFGGRMLQAGRDVTFLVRPRRAAELASAGLVIKSPNGDVTLTAPPSVQADKLDKTFDLVLLSCKAFDLEDAIKSFAPAVGPKTAILPLLNGMRHLDMLDRRFGANACSAAFARSPSRSTSAARSFSSRRCSRLDFGERDGKIVGPGAGHRGRHGKRQFWRGREQQIIQDMWEKWVFLASLAAATCLMRAPVGNILAAPGGKDFILGILDECSAVASAEGHRPARSILRTCARHADRVRFATHRVDVPRHQGGCPGRGRSRDRRSDRARRRREGAGAEAADRLYASEGL